MHRPIPHLSRTSLQMFSGAAGLIAAFTSISLLFSLPGVIGNDGLPGLLPWGRTTILALSLGFAVVAYTLLRFSLSHEDRLHSDALHQSLHQFGSRNPR